MNKSINFKETVPYRSPNGPLINFEPYFTNKKVCDLGCGSGDMLLYVQNTFKCEKIIGIDNSSRSIYNIEKYNLDIKPNSNFLENMPYNFDTYYIWVEIPNAESQVLELLRGYKINSNNFSDPFKRTSDYNVIIAYNTAAICKDNPDIPNSIDKFNGNCSFCRSLNAIPSKISFLESFLNTNNYSYIKKSYSYNDGLSCRESGEFTYYVVTI